MKGGFRKRILKWWELVLEDSEYTPED